MTDYYENINLTSEDPTIIPTPNPSTFIADEKVMKDDMCKVDLREPLTPHNDLSNPFAFAPEQLSALMDPKNLPLLRSYGGLDGVARGLHVDLQTGLIPNAPQHPRITLDQVIATKQETPVDFKRSGTIHSIGGRQLTHRTDTNIPSPDFNAFPQRKHVFGSNVLPETETKSIFTLMWIAFQDKTLVYNSFIYKKIKCITYAKSVFLNRSYWPLQLSSP